MVIPPGESQTLRILVRRPPDLQDENAEFHAHLAVRSVPTVPKLREVADPEIPDLENVVIARPQVSVETLVPIIVRFGRPGATLELADSWLETGPEPGSRTLHLIMNRGGDRSIYGDITVDYVAPDGQQTNLVYSRGCAIYTEVARRILSIDLSQHPAIDPARGKVVLDYRETAKGRGDLLLHETLDLSSLPLR
jgi:hypothetical protein